MHFAGATDPEAGETPAARIEALYQSKGETPAAGDIVIDGTKEYVYDGSAWKELGDEGTYATKAELETAVSGIQIGGVTLGNDKAITAQELIDALGLKALAFKDSAAGSVVVPAASQTLAGLAKAGEYTVSGEAVAVPKTFTALDVTPAGSVSATAQSVDISYDKVASVSYNEVTAASYDKVSGIAISSAAPGDGQTANYTPAGNVSVSANASATFNPDTTSVATVTDAGTEYALSGGSVSKADDTKANFASEGVTAHMASGAEISGDTDAETLIFAAAATAQAVTAAGTVSYTAPTLTGALPTFGNATVATGGTISLPAFSGSFTGTGALISASANFTPTDANLTSGPTGASVSFSGITVTVPAQTITASFSGTTKSVTPAVATSVQAAPADAKITVTSEDKAITLATETKNITVS